jgi:hypothetical protein
MVGRKGSRSTPLGSGYFMLTILGLMLITFATGLVAYPIATDASNQLFTNNPCLMWVFIIFILILGSSIYWLGERQGKKTM